MGLKESKDASSLRGAEALNHRLQSYNESRLRATAG